MASFPTIEPDTDDWSFLTKELDRAKSAAFTGKSAAFLGSLLCSMDFVWTRSIPTAATNGVTLWWNPNFFQKLLPETRQTVLIHELWHPGRLHFIRRGDRDPRIWNFATDIRINNDLIDEGWSFKGIEWAWKDPKIPKDMAEEDIYDQMVANAIKIPTYSPFGDPSEDGPGDMVSDDQDGKDTQVKAINNVVRAIQQAKLAKEAGNLPGDIETILNRFLQPVVPWQQILANFMRDLVEETYTWHRPNRRYTEMYLPSRYNDEGKLSELIYYEDVSGSISDEDAVRFNSEFKYVKDTFRPKSMRLVQFDTEITQELHYEEDDPFNQVKIIGRGGTSLVPVREHIIKHKPTAAIIFSDLECAPMEPLPLQIPVIWVCISNRKAVVPFGQITHIH